MWTCGFIYSLLLQRFTFICVKDAESFSEPQDNADLKSVVDRDTYDEQKYQTPKNTSNWKDYVWFCREKKMKKESQL